MNFKNKFFSALIIFACILMNTNNTLANNFKHYATNILGSGETYEQNAITVGLSFTDVKKTEHNEILDFITPLLNPVVTSTFDFNNTGVFLATFDENSVFCIADGEILEVGHNDEYGNFIKIKHEHDYISFYANLQEISSNTHFFQGDIIGKMHNLDVFSNPHLYFELSLNDVLIDPCSIIDFYAN